MIPLAQFLSDENEDEFVPLRAQAPRRPPVAAPRAFEAGLPRVSSPAAQAPRMAPKPATAAPAMRPTLRTVVGGALALTATWSIGVLLGTAGIA